MQILDVSIIFDLYVVREAEREPVRLSSLSVQTSKKLLEVWKTENAIKRAVLRQLTKRQRYSGCLPPSLILSEPVSARGHLFDRLAGLCLLS